MDNPKPRLNSHLFHRPSAMSGGLTPVADGSGRGRSLRSRPGIDKDKIIGPMSVPAQAALHEPVKMAEPPTTTAQAKPEGEPSCLRAKLAATRNERDALRAQLQRAREENAGLRKHYLIEVKDAQAQKYVYRRCANELEDEVRKLKREVEALRRAGADRW